MPSYVNDLQTVLEVLAGSVEYTPDWCSILKIALRGRSLDARARFCICNRNLGARCGMLQITDSVFVEYIVSLSL